MEPSDPPPVPMPEVDLEQLEKLKKETFRGLMSQRTWILEDHAHDLKKLDDERDQRLRDNYAKMVSLGIPEEELPLPPENSEKKAARLAEKVMFRKLKEEEIKRVLREVMRPNENYTAAELLQHLEISYKDWMGFCRFNIPSFLKTEGKGPRWITYNIA